MARVLKGSHLHTPRSSALTGWTIPAFAFPAEAGTYLPTYDSDIDIREQCISAIIASDDFTTQSILYLNSL